MIHMLLYIPEDMTYLSQTRIEDTMQTIQIELQLLMFPAED